MSPSGARVLSLGARPHTRRACRTAPFRRDALAQRTALERKFVAAGGVLMTGPDLTPTGGIVPGFGDCGWFWSSRLHAAEVIKIATLNGATFRVQDRIGSIAPRQKTPTS